jgi:hypothetical protein
MNLRNFCEKLDPGWQAEIIAAYLIDNQIEAVLAQDSAPKRTMAEANQAVRAEANERRPKGSNPNRPLTG